jgi:hypothetical protein
MQTGKLVGFRAPDDDFCHAFNLALQATGGDVTALAVEAIRAGLPSAVDKLLTERRSAAAEFLKKFPKGSK